MCLIFVMVHTSAHCRIYYKRRQKPQLIHCAGAFALSLSVFIHTTLKHQTFSLRIYIYYIFQPNCIYFQSTCHTALDACKENLSCQSSVQPVLMHCDLHRCNRNACMDALQSFYRASHEDLSLDVAFCLCK